MLKRFCTVFTLLLVFGLSAVLIGDELETIQYFPGTLGSYWVYVDQDGNELTRRAVEGEEIAEKVYGAFSYEPVLENSIDHDYHIHPSLYQVNEKGVMFLVGDEARSAVQARLTKEMEAFLKYQMKMIEESAPPGTDADFELLYKIEVEAQDEFYMLPTSATLNEKWDAAQIKAKITLIPDPPEEDLEKVILEFTINEMGKVLGRENVEAPAGTFEDCLKIEYRTYTGVAIFPNEAGEEEDANPPGESVTTLWVAPNVGIVKYHQKAEDIFLKIVPMPGIVTSTTVKTLELKKYEIKSADSEGDKND